MKIITGVFLSITCCLLFLGYTGAKYVPNSTDNTLLSKAYTKIDSIDPYYLDNIKKIVDNSLATHSDNERVVFVLGEIKKYIENTIGLVEQEKKAAIPQVDKNSDRDLRVESISLFGNIENTINVSMKNIGDKEIGIWTTHTLTCYSHGKDVLPENGKVIIDKEQKLESSISSYQGFSTDVKIPSEITHRESNIITCKSYLKNAGGDYLGEKDIQNNTIQKDMKSNAYLTKNSTNRDFAVSKFSLKQKESLEKIEIHPNYQGDLNELMFVDAYFTVHNYGDTHTSFPRVFGASYKNGNNPLSNSISYEYISGCRHDFSNYENIAHGKSCQVKVELIIPLDSDISEYNFSVRIGAESEDPIQTALYNGDENYDNNITETSLTTQEVESI